jgi:hypothetical protein
MFKGVIDWVQRFVRDNAPVTISLTAIILAKEIYDWLEFLPYLGKAMNWLLGPDWGIRLIIALAVVGIIWGERSRNRRLYLGQSEIDATRNRLNIVEARSDEVARLQSIFARLVFLSQTLETLKSHQDAFEASWQNVMKVLENPSMIAGHDGGRTWRHVTTQVPEMLLRIEQFSRQTLRVCCDLSKAPGYERNSAAQVQGEHALPSEEWKHTLRRLTSQYQTAKTLIQSEMRARIEFEIRSLNERVLAIGQEAN